MLSQERFPADMGVLSNQTFSDIYNTNQEFVDFSRKHITKPTGTFKKWMQYLRDKS